MQRGEHSTTSSLPKPTRTASLNFRSSRAREALDKTVLEGSRGIIGAGSIAVLPDCDTVVFRSWRGRFLHVHSLADGRRLHTLEGSIFGTRRVIVLDQDIILSTHYSSSVCVWRVSSGELLHKAKLSKRLKSVVAVCADTVIVAYDDGALAEMNWTGSLLMSSGREVAAGEDGHTGCILDLVATPSRFAARSRFGKVKIWDVKSFRSIATLDACFDVVARGMDMNEKWLAITSDKPPGIFVYDTELFLPQRFLSYAPDEHHTDIELSDDNEYLLVGFFSGLKVYEIASNQVLWSMEALPGLGVATCKGGRILVAPYKKRAEVLCPPPDVAAKIAPSQHLVHAAAILPEHLPPLQDALASVLAATSTAASHCRQLVTADNCSASVAEWHSAHQLLMFAIRDAQLPKSMDYEGKKSWWFEQLYLTAHTFSLSAEDENIVRNCLREAKQMGVIEGEQPILANIKIAQEIRTEVRGVHSACVNLCYKFLAIEGAVDRLKSSLESYMRTQRVSQLIGIGLQLVPFIGGATAGMISVGAEVTSGLDLKEIVEAGIGFGVNASEENVVSFSERVLSKLSSIFSEKQIAKLESDRKERLEGLVTECGFSLEALRLQFREAREKVAQEPGTGSEDPAGAKGTEGSCSGLNESEEKGIPPCGIINMPEDVNRNNDPPTVCSSAMECGFESNAADHATVSCAQPSGSMQTEEQEAASADGNFSGEHNNLAIESRQAVKWIERGQPRHEADFDSDLQPSAEIEQDKRRSRDQGSKQLADRVEQLELARAQDQRHTEEHAKASRERAQASHEQVQALVEQVRALQQENAEQKGLLQRWLQEKEKV